MNKILVIIFVFIPFFASSFKLQRVCNSNLRSNHLFWNNKFDTCQRFGKYSIYGREGSGDSFRILDSLKNYSTSDFTHKPDPQNIRKWQYFIKVTYYCGGNKKREISDTLKIDFESPPAFSLDSVSVVNGKVVLGWSPNAARDVKGYLVYFVDESGQNRFLDTVYGKFNTNYEDRKIGNPEKKGEKYRIAAFDSCGNSSPLSLDTHQTVFMTILQDTCKGHVFVDWSAYQGWKVEKYKILIYDEIGVERIREVPGSRRNMLVEDLKGGMEYEFIVRAINKNDNNVTSSSNRIKIKNRLLVNPDYVYLNRVTVDKGEILLEWSISQESDLLAFEILRGVSKGSVKKIQEVNYVGGTKFSYRDKKIDPGEEIRFYRIVAKNLCKREVGKSNISSNILLEVRNRNTQNELSWNQYTGWSGEVIKYEIYRVTKGQKDNDSLVDSIKYNVLDAKVDVRGEGGEGDCYVIKAVEGGNHVFGKKSTSYSNIACVYPDPVVYIPNAFTPEGINPEFKPKGLFIDHEKSYMNIYDQWGQKIATIEDLGKGWKGKIKKNNTLAPEGSYLYLIHIVGKNGKVKNYRGSVLLLLR